MVVHGHLLCRNEIELVPFVMDYWKRLGVDRLFVWDNGSTDGTIEALKAYDFVTIIPFASEGGYNDEYLLTTVRNLGWKRMSKDVADWVIVSDFDEVPYFIGRNDKKDPSFKVSNYEDFPDFDGETFRDWLEFLDDEKVSIVRTRMHQLIRKDFPEYKPELMHTYEGGRYYDENHRFDKTLLFNCKKVEETNYQLGAHDAQFIARGLFMEYPSEYCMFHLKYLGEDYVINKSKRLYDNLRPDIKEGNVIDSHYLKLIEDYQFYADMFWNNGYDKNIN